MSTLCQQKQDFPNATFCVRRKRKRSMLCSSTNSTRTPSVAVALRIICMMPWPLLLLRLQSLCWSDDLTCRVRLSPASDRRKLASGGRTLPPTDRLPVSRLRPTHTHVPPAVRLRQVWAYICAFMRPRVKTPTSLSCLVFCLSVSLSLFND